MGCGASAARPAADSPTDGGARQRAAVDYDSVESLWKALASGDVFLLRGSWLVERAERGQLLPRRQDCPADAFIPLRELQKIHEESSAKPEDADAKRAPVLAISHFWRAREHPDPRGETLQLLGHALKERLPTYRQHGFSDVGLFLDWSSLHQSPRSEAEENAFKRSLAWINLWYAHALSTVYLVTETPEGIVPYHDRGWTSFELQLSYLIKLTDKFNIWPQVVDLGSAAQSRPALAAPDAFGPGGACGNKTYTNGSDRERVAKKFKESCEDIFGSVTELDYDSLGWGDAEVAALGTVLPFCHSLRRLDLSRNYSSRLPEGLGGLGALEALYLQGCSALAALPESLGGLGALEALYLHGCSALAALPESLGGLGALETLDLQGCSALAALPASLGGLGALKKLDLQGCSALAALPESLGDLGALETLDLQGCSALAALPESLGDLGALETLYLRDCSALAALPASLGGLGALKTLSLQDCSALAALPASLGGLGALETLNLWGCSALAALPESLGGLGALETLYLWDCSALAALPESLGQLEQRGCRVLRP